MRAFASLLDDLSFTAGRNDKLALLTGFFRATPDPDRGWALASLTDGLALGLPLRRILADLMGERVDAELFRLSRDYVGDTAETVALLWPDGSAPPPPVPTLHAIVGHLAGAGRHELAGIIANLLDCMNVRERWAFLKFIGGAPRVGVSARLAKLALAAAFGRDVDEIEEVWHGLAPPYATLFDWLTGKGSRPAASTTAFRPMMLATPLEEDDIALLHAGEFSAEWKWDGIRVQIAADGNETRVYSRTGDDIAAAFPDVAAAFSGQSVVADGELLVARQDEIAPFSDLQQRLNRKRVSAARLARYPAFVRLYDLLWLEGDDLRPLPFAERRSRLEAWHQAAPPPATDVSPLIEFSTFDELRGLRAGARAAAIEGLMLKRKQSPYLAGRPKGHWFKWKRQALTLDCVLMYAQRGSGKRSSYYSDYTFGVWREQNGARDLVPIGKAYSGFTDEELRRLDRFIRNHTVEQFGPVRAVAPQLVLEVAFDALQASVRHKSGLAMRFPRIHRIRWDKPADEADTLASAKSLIAPAR